MKLKCKPFNPGNLCLFLILLYTPALVHAQPKQDVTELVQQNLTALGLSKTDLPNFYVSDSHTDKLSGAQIVYLQQQYKSVKVHNAVYSIAFKDGKVISASNNFVQKIQAKAPSEVPAISAPGALSVAAIHLRLGAAASLSPKHVTGNGKNVAFAKGGLSKNDIPVDLVWVSLRNGDVRLAWNVRIEPPGTQDMWNIRVDAMKGVVLEKDNLTVYCNYDHRSGATGGMRDVNKRTHVHHKAENAQYSPAAGSSLPEMPLTANANYGVIPYPAESSIYPGGAQAIRTNPWLMAGAGNPAVTYGWHFDGTTNYPYTRGNNVLAREDIDGDDATPGSVASSTSTFPELNFLYPLTPGEPQSSPTNLSASITNLFYWNNIMHDISYQYGFDEASGNFQNDNLGRGGEGNDYVIAEVQDGSGFANANFRTPVDGLNGQMQMFLFPSSDARYQVNEPASIAGVYNFVESNISAVNHFYKTGPKTGRAVLYNDNAGGTTHTACSPPVNATEINGNIALIDRGNCDFDVKVKNAQNAGAIAVIVINNIPGPPIIMGSSVLDNSITIPAVMISQDNGNLIRTELQNNVPVNITLQVPRYTDGALDNSVIAHEYTHGITNRLTGGRENPSCLSFAESESGGMGEGWSDYYSLMVTTDWTAAGLSDGNKPRTIGNYVYDMTTAGPGIRKYPYSTDMSVNPLTYGKMATETEGIIHSIGEIWCAALWDLTWGIINMDGTINTNLYNAEAAGGNTTALKLVMLGLKLQPCVPGFLDSRDAILRADTILYGGKYSCLLWRAFARRGMGLNARQGFAQVYTDQVENFDIPSGATFTKTVNKNFAMEGDNLTYTLSVKCQCVPLNGLTLQDTLSPDVTHISGGTLNGNVLTYTPINLTEQQLAFGTVEVKVNPGVFSPPVIQLTETVTEASINNAVWTTTADLSFFVWGTTNTLFRTPGHAFAGPDPGTRADFSLATTNSYPISRITTLSFWHIFDLEPNYDGGVVELSTDNGATWIDAGPYMIGNGYNTRFNPDLETPLAGRPVFNGYSDIYKQTTIDLSRFTGYALKFRFRICTDQSVGAHGWYIDDIQLRNEAGIVNIGYLYNGNTLLSTSSARTLIPAAAAPLPVVFSAFEASKQHRAVLVQWATSTEINSHKFEIEKSLDGISFSAIGTVHGAGNSSVTNRYSFTDGKPVNGVNYYRLKQIDTDGKVTYSPVRTVVFNNAGQEIMITPNPSKGLVTIILPPGPENTVVNVFDNRGLLVYKNELRAGTQKLDLSNLSKGLYFLHFNVDDKTIIKKLLIQ